METPAPIKSSSKAPPLPAAKSAASSHNPTPHSPLSTTAARLGNQGMQRLLKSSAPAIPQSATSVPPGIGGPPVTVRTDPAATAFLRDNHAAGAALDTSTIAVDPRYASSPGVLPHEYAHVAQLRSGRTASRADSERAATNYARGQSPDPGGAAAPPLFQPIANVGLDDNPLRPAVDWRLTAEARDLSKLGPESPGADSKIEGLLDHPDFSSEDRNLVEITVTAAGEKGTIESLTRFTLHRDPEQKFGYVFVGPPSGHDPGPDPNILTANDIEGIGRPGPLAPSEDVPIYPIILKYERIIKFTDRQGRACNVIATSTMYFTYDTWDSETSGATASLATIQSLKADLGLTSAMIAGRSKLLSYDASSFSEAPTIDAAIAQAQAGIQASHGFKDAADLPMTFVRPDETAGAQFETLQAVLFRLDEKEQERLDKMKVVDFFGASGDDEEEKDDTPDWLKGLNSALTKALIGVLAAAAVAGIIFLSPLEIGFAAAFGLVLLTMAIYSLGSSLVNRFKEARQQGSWDLLAVAGAAIGDLFGIAGIYEGSTNQSFLFGRNLNLSDEQRWEVGFGGVLGLILAAIGVRSAAKSYYKVPGLEPLLEPGNKPAQSPPEPVRDADPDLTIRDEHITTEPTTRRSGRTYIGGRRVPDKDFNQPKPGTRPLDVEEFQRPGETRAGAVGRLQSIIGRRISDTPFAPTWNRIVTRLKGGKTVAELGKNQTLAIYKRAQGEFWIEVAADPALRQHLADAGIGFEPGHRAPLVQVNDPAAIPWYERKINLDHLAEKAIGDNWKRALDADNLEFKPQGSNQHRETTQARHPNHRPDNN